MRPTSILLAASALFSLSSAAAVPHSPWHLKDLFPKAFPAVGSCDCAKVPQPAAPTPLPAPAQGLKLAMIAIGKGTQNYTCNSTLPAPVQVGAKATLYDASCLAKSRPQSELNDLTALAERVPPSQIPASILAAGVHYFVGSHPAFDIPVYGPLTQFAKVAQSSAPTNTNGNVAWLQLTALSTDSKMQQVYRLETVGGSPPSTCQGQPDNIYVDYAAQYWVYTQK